VKTSVKVPVAGWRPILTGALKKEALKTIADIAEALKMEKARDGSLAGGAAGFAIFYHYLAQARSGTNDREMAEWFMNRALEAVANTPMTSSLYSGFTGIAWTCEHLQSNISNRVVDQALLKYLKKNPRIDDFDLISGLVGLGVYALERVPDSSAAEILKLIVARLDTLSEKTSEGIAWRTSVEILPDWQRKAYPNGYYNLGLAHGIPGIIAILGAAYGARIESNLARKLLDGAFKWMSRHKLPRSFDSTFPAWTSPDIPPESCRSAWCYGDPGIAASLILAAKCFNNRAWEKEALKIALRSANRLPDAAGVKDAGLCHGSAGLGHIFNRMFQATGNAKLKGAARFWFQQTLKFRRKGQGFAGYSSYRLKEDGTAEWHDDAELLNGSAGIGLALLAAISPVAPDWDRMLLLSIRKPRVHQKKGSVTN
jgi:lantibiotic modifying enzyme